MDHMREVNVRARIREFAAEISSGITVDCLEIVCAHSRGDITEEECNASIATIKERFDIALSELQYQMSKHKPRG